MALVNFSSSALFPQLVVIFPVVVPESPSLGLRPVILGHSRLRELEAPGLQISHINPPIHSKMAHVRAQPFHKPVITTLACLPTVF